MSARLIFSFFVAFIAGVLLDGKALSGFEIFQIAFQHGRSSCIRDLNLQPELTVEVFADLKLYMSRLPMGKKGWKDTWQRWSDELGESQGSFFSSIVEIEQYSQLMQLLMDVSEFPDAEKLVMKLQSPSPMSADPRLERLERLVAEMIFDLWIAFCFAMTSVLHGTIVMCSFFLFLVFIFAYVTACFLELNGVYKDGKQMSAFEIFQIAFKPARAGEIADISVGWPLPEQLRSDLEPYLMMVPLDEAACMALWDLWRQAYEEWSGQQEEPLAEVYGGVTLDWTDFRWAYFDFMRVLLECYPPEALDVDIDRTMSRLCEHWPRRRMHLMGLRSEVALFLAIGFLHVCMIIFLVNVFNTIGCTEQQ